jgi:hypothetical protein
MFRVHPFQLRRATLTPLSWSHRWSVGFEAKARRTANRVRTGGAMDELWKWRASG